MSSLYILDASSLLDVWFASVFFKSVVSFYPLNLVFHRAKVFNFDEVLFENFFLYGSCFLVSKNSA